MSDHNEPFDGDETLHKDKVHEENHHNKEYADAHQNPNPNQGREHNPHHADQGGR